MASATLVAFADLPFIFIFLIVLYLIGGPIAAVPGIIVILVIIIGLRATNYQKDECERHRTAKPNRAY